MRMRLNSNMVDVLIRGRDAKNVHTQVRPCEDRERRCLSASLWRGLRRNQTFYTWVWGFRSSELRDKYLLSSHWVCGI